MRQRCTCIVAAAGIIFAACERTYFHLDAPAALAVDPAFASVAPRETLRFTASVAGATFSFASNGQGSGANASIDAQSGVYQAGSNGSAVDIVEVSAGASMVSVRITVGPVLSVTPTDATLAPGGKLVIAPRGGKSPYAFSLTKGTGSTSTLDASDATATFTADTGGNRSEGVIISDATLDASVAVTATLHITQPLTLIPSSTNATIAVAPSGALHFFAVGGQAPYVFTVSDDQSGGGINTAGGDYLAGATGSVHDTVQVEDDNHQLRFAVVTVGPALALSLDQSEARPGVTRQLVVSGGQAPFRFAFADKGNCSRGAVDAFAGGYSPGANVGANDTLAVTDANLVTQTLTVPILPERVPAGRAPELVASDFDGDSAQELNVLQPSWFGGLHTLWHAGTPDDPSAALARYSFGTGASGNLLDVVAFDFDLDGRGDLAVLTSDEITFYPGQADGRLGAAVVLALAGQSEQLFQPLQLTTEINGKLHLFATLVRDLSGTPPPMPCTIMAAGATGPTAGGIVDVVWTTSTPPPLASPPSCLLGFDANTFATTFAAGDFDADGFTDLGWASNTSTVSHVLHATAPPRAAQASFDVVALAAPGATGVVVGLQPVFLDQTQAVAAARSDLGVLLGDLTLASRQWVYVTRQASSWIATTPASAPPTRPFTATIAFNPLRNASLAQPRFELFADSFDGTVLRGQWQKTPVASASGGGAFVLSPLNRSFDFEVDGLGQIDVDGDGFNDLAASSGQLDSTEIWLGEGDGTFARRPRFHGFREAFTGDLDQDGLTDVVTSTADPPGFAVFFGTDHQLAYAIQHVDAEPAIAAWVGDVFADGTSGIVTGSQIGALSIHRYDKAQKTLGAPQPIVVSTPVIAGVANGFGHFGPGHLSPYLWAVVDPSDVAPRVLVRDTPQSGTLLTSSPSPLTLGAQNCVEAVADLTADALDDLIVACAFAPEIDVAVATASVGPVFSAWSLYTPSGASLTPAATSVQAPPSYAGTLGNRAYFVYANGTPSTPPAGGEPHGFILAVSASAGPQIALSLPYYPRGAAHGAIVAGGGLQIAIAEASTGRLHVYVSNGAGGFAESPLTASSVVVAPGAPAVTLTLAPGGLADVITVYGTIGNVTVVPIVGLTP